MPSDVTPQDGGNPAAGSQTTESQSTPSPTPVAQPSAAPSGPLTLSDDSEVIWEGAAKPVKFSELRGLQSQFTKVSQARAALEKESKARADEVSRLQNALRVALGEQVQGPRVDPLDQIKTLPYVKGEELAQILRQRQGQDGQVMQVLQVMAQKIAEQQQMLQTLHSTHATKSFDEKINTSLRKLGLDPEDYSEEAKIFYLAHEGDDLDEQFPDMFSNYLKKRGEREKARQQRLREKARQVPFVPGKGGLTTASGETDMAKMSPKQIADSMWDALQANET